jgi:hypothetical protein
VTDDDIKDGSLEVRPVALSDVTNLVTNDTVGLGAVSTTSICGLIHDSANDTGKSATDNLTANTRPLIGGTVEPGATVTLTIGGQSVVTTASVRAILRYSRRMRWPWHPHPAYHGNQQLDVGGMGYILHRGLINRGE